MKNTLLITILFLFTFSASAEETIGFKGGNNFESRMIVGDITIKCDGSNGESDFRSHTCRSEILDPNEYAKFEGFKGLDAEEVILNAIHEDGSSREKNESFDPATGLSKGSFNLWIATVFQRPLLEMGKNLVYYSLTKGGNNVVAGSFEAIVSRKETNYCSRRGNYYSHQMSDCQFPDRVCGQYFREQNYCK